MNNKLFFGDNMEVLQRDIKGESVDLIYLDPPFNSEASYNILFKSPVGEPSDAQIKAFDDTWKWEAEAEQAVEEVRSRSLDAFKVLNAFQAFLGHSDMMAYLAMMTVRLIELHRVMKPTGSLYLHCDPNASHYLKVILDGIFGPENFRNEIVWLRSRNPKGSQHVSRRFGPATDSILYYAKSSAAALAVDRIRKPLSDTELEEKYPLVDGIGRYADGPILRSDSMGPRPKLVYEYKGFTPGAAGWRVKRKGLEEIDAAGNLVWTKTGRPRRKLRPDADKGEPIGSFWGDIPPVNSQAEERIGYPTQKPRPLLERIIEASSNPGDVILDPFCGCGTTIHAAAKLGRQWLGIDITYLAIQVIEARLKKYLPFVQYDLSGIPKDDLSGRALAKLKPYQFQLWAVGRCGGRPGGKGADRGIDGEISFLTGVNQYGRGIVSVKAGQHINPDMVRALKGTVQREHADLGIFVCVDPPTKDMKTEAVTGGFVDLPGGKRPRIQIVTLKDLLAGPNLGILTTLDAVQAADEARRLARRPKAGETPEEMRRQPRFKYPIKGGRSKELPLEDFKLEVPQKRRSR
jgi:site-specific DNA-methyltransferase (adenine-specific)